MKNDLDIERFVPELQMLSRRPDPIIYIVGPRGSGKTSVAKSLVYVMRKVNDAVVMSATEAGNRTWGENFPSSYIYEEFKPHVIESIVQNKKLMCLRNKRDPARYKMTSTLIIAEDLMFNASEFTNDKSIKFIAMNGRHYKIPMLVTVQYQMDLSRQMRSQVDYLFVMADNDMGNRKRLWENWFGIIPTFEAFNELMMKLTENFGCMVLDNTKKTSYRIEDCIYWFKAIPRGNFKVGSRDYWAYHYKNKKSDEEIEQQYEKENKERKNSKTTTVGRKTVTRIKKVY